MQHQGASPSGDVCFSPGSVTEDTKGKFDLKNKRQTNKNQEINYASLKSSSAGNTDFF